MVKRRDRWGAALFGALLLIAGAPSGALAVGNCSFSNGVVTVNVTGSGSVLSRSNDTIVLDGQPCGTATVNNTDTVRILKTGFEAVDFVLDLAQPFAPGASAEAAGTSEIEFQLGLGFTLSAGFDKFEVRGSTAADNYDFGVDGINLNGDADSDVSWNLTPEFGSPILDLHVYGLNGDDVISGRGGAGTGSALDLPLNAFGGSGNDSLTGSDSYDILEGGPGADAIDGGDVGAEAGTNIAQYKESTAGVNVNLTTGIGSGGDALGDTLTNIDTLFGSSFADTLVGNTNGNAFQGFGGADQISGFDGDDLIAYLDSPAGVHVDLASAQATGGDAQGDTFTAIENVLGSEFEDVLTGNAGANFLGGVGGDDTVEGGDGEDTIEGGHGEDHELGGAGDDYFWAGFEFDDNDVIDGGDGKDYINYHGRGVSVRLSLDGQANDGDPDQNEKDNITNVEKLGACSGNDVVKGSKRNDIVKAREGNDKVTGGAGNDSIDGGPGKDVIDGGPGRDVCFVTKGDKTSGCEQEKRAH
ncbi:MAG: hypothetical protein QOG54_2284 [Actinomycetota bacterium]|jgi:Ca2+-binding RTX toxin-like protein|nr:hypothetical protein [Actinomycetota bacterium]